MADYKVTDADRKFATGFAGRGADRWHRDFFKDFAARERLTEGQRSVLERAREQFRGMVDGVRVRNRYPSCWQKGCHETATVAVDGCGYCTAHADEKRAALKAAATEKAAAWEARKKEQSGGLRAMLDLLDEAG